MNTHQVTVKLSEVELPGPQHSRVLQLSAPGLCLELQWSMHQVPCLHRLAQEQSDPAARQLLGLCASGWPEFLGQCQRSQSSTLECCKCSGSSSSSPVDGQSAGSAHRGEQPLTHAPAHSEETASTEEMVLPLLRNPQGELYIQIPVPAGWGQHAVALCRQYKNRLQADGTQPGPDAATKPLQPQH
jgi:hypothetical protein